jgi:hypothetical protein
MMMSRTVDENVEMTGTDPAAPGKKLHWINSVMSTWRCTREHDRDRRV